MILRPDGAPSKRRVVPLNRVDVKTVIEFERWCEAMGLKLDLYCPRCTDSHGPKGARCWGNNHPDDSSYHLECLCTDRVYGTNAVDRGVPRIVEGDKRIQIVVP